MTNFDTMYERSQEKIGRLMIDLEDDRYRWEEGYISDEELYITAQMVKSVVYGFREIGVLTSSEADEMDAHINEMCECLY